MSKLKEGDVINIENGHSVYAEIPRHKVTIDDAFSYLAGKYIVIKVAMDGGGAGHGFNDVYPDGYHVYCVSEDGKTKIDFYQSGAFTAKIEDIKPVGKAKLTWTIEQNHNEAE